MKTSKYLVFLVVLTIVGCGQPDHNTEKLVSKNDLLLASINADYLRFEKSAVYRQSPEYQRRFEYLSVKLKPSFRFLTDISVLRNNDYRQNRLDTLREVTEAILSREHIINEPTISLFKEQIASIEKQMKVDFSSNQSATQIEALRNEIFQLEKFIICSDLEYHYYYSFSLIDSLAIKVVPERQVVKIGEPYRAKVYLAAYATLGLSDITLFEKIENRGLILEGVNPIDTFKVKTESDGYIEYLPKTIGEQSLGISWPMRTNSNVPVEYFTTATFTVEK